MGEQFDCQKNRGYDRYYRKNNQQPLLTKCCSLEEAKIITIGKVEDTEGVITRGNQKP
jgi:hypothetical protein